MAEQAAIEAKIEAVNRAEVERERLMKMKEKEQEKMAAAEMMMAAAKEEQEAEMAEMMALGEAEKMAMVEAEKMVAEEVAKEVVIGSVLLAFDVKRSLRRVQYVCLPIDDNSNGRGVCLQIKCKPHICPKDREERGFLYNSKDKRGGDGGNLRFLSIIH